MRHGCITALAIVALCLAGSMATAQTVVVSGSAYTPVTTYRPVGMTAYQVWSPAPVVAYNNPIVTYRVPAVTYGYPVVTYRPITGYTPYSTYAPVAAYGAPVVVGPTVVRVSPYVPGQPVRNVLRSIAY